MNANDRQWACREVGRHWLDDTGKCRRCGYLPRPATPTDSPNSESPASPERMEEE